MTAARTAFGAAATVLLLTQMLALAPVRRLETAGPSQDARATASEPRHRELHVSPIGSKNNDGTLERPLDLATALSKKSPAHPGDIIWLHGGTYRGTFVSHLTGRPGAPITVRQAPGERATIDTAGLKQDALLVYGAWTWYWGFEITNSDLKRESAERGSWPDDLRRGAGVTARGSNVKFINLVVHDMTGGFGIWEDAADTEAYGNLIYYNGWVAPDRGHGHGIYTQNSAPSKRLLRDNIIFGQFSHGIHAYGSERAALDNMVLDGNVAFNNGSLAGDYARDILIGGGRVAANPFVRNNFTYGQAQSNVGYSAGCTNGRILGNFFGVGAFVLANCDPQLEENTFFGSIPSHIREEHPDNTFLEGASSGTITKQRANRFEPGRSHIIVYNPTHEQTVRVKLPGLVCSPTADRFEIRDAQNFLGPPVAAGSCKDSRIDLPMTNLTVAAPVGSVAEHPRHTAPEFAVFVVLPAAPASRVVD